MRRALVLALLLAACHEEGTGALLELHGSGAIDELDVTAHLASGDVTRTAMVQTSLPTTYLAILPGVTETVTFDVTAKHAGALVGVGSSAPVKIEPHHVPRVDVELGGVDGGTADLATIDGGAFTIAHAGTATLTSVWASGNDVWITADATTDNVLRSSDGGKTFASMTVGATALRGVFGVGGLVFLVGDGGAIFSGTSTFTQEPNPTGPRDLKGVWGTSATDLYAVGASSTILHRVTGGWVEEGAIGATTLEAVWGSDTSHVWIVGDGGTILSSSGNGVWSTSTNGTQALRAVSGTSASDVWIAGDGGTLLHATGGAFTATTSGTSDALYALTPMLAAGDAWTVLELSGATPVATGLSGSGALYGAFADQRTWLVGSGGTILSR